MTQPSQTVANYEFLNIVDKPKAGVTYKVRNLTTGEFEILRTLGATYNDPESSERFLREIKIHTRLAHPNIVTFHDALELDGHLVMTTEFVEGTTLSQLCGQGPLRAAEAIRMIVDVLSGLEEAHALGIVHRGITAEHVTITGGGQVKLGGFGLAKPASDVNLTKAGAVIGNARYISPEQVMGVEALDARADIYSVGILLFLALTGRVPFDGTNDFDVMVAQVGTQPPRPSFLNPEISPELEGIVLTALAKKPGERFPGAREFRMALAAVKAPVKVLRQPAAPVEATQEGMAPAFLVQSGSGGIPTTAIMLGFLCLAIGLAVLFFVAMN